MKGCLRLPFRNANSAVLGLGVMGYPMAINLLNGLGPEKTFLICDVSEDALSRFQSESKGKAKATVKVIENGFEAAKSAVR